MKKPVYEVVSLNGELDAYTQSGKEYCTDQCQAFITECAIVCTVFCITECENGQLTIEY